MKSCLIACQGVNEAQGSLFEVPAGHKSQKSILFRRIASELMPREDSESENKFPQFPHYELNVLRMMENMGYDLTKGPGLNFGKGRRTLLWSFVPKGKALIIIIKLAGGWVMCQLQSRKPLSLKGHYTVITRQAHHHGSQMSVLATSSKNFR